MKKLLSYSYCVVVLAQTATASSGVSFHPETVHKYAKAPLRYSTYGQYLQYNRKKLFEGLDSANAFYKREIERRAYTFTDYLPLTAGSSYSLTGTLFGTGANFSSDILINSITVGKGAGTEVTNTAVGTSNLSSNTSGRYSTAIGYNALVYSNTDGNTAVGESALYQATGNWNTSLGRRAGLYITTGSYNTIIGANIYASSAINNNVILGDGAGTIRFQYDGSNTLLGQSGNTGIGTSSPEYKLDVGDQAATSDIANSLRISGRAGASGDGSGNVFGNIIISNSADYLSDNFKIEARSQGNTNGVSALFYVNNSLAPATPLMAMALKFNGNVGIGTTSPTEKLSVDGNIYTNGNISANGVVTTKKLTITQTGWSDYVFNKDYKLRTLQQVETFIKENNHLPEIPSAKEVEEKGISVGDNQALLLKKIEELTLYMIKMNRENAQMKKEIQQLKKLIDKK